MSPAWLRDDLAAHAPAFSFSAALAVVGPGARFRPHLSLAFPAGEVVAAGRLDGVWHLTLGLPGLYGTNSPLPTSYTEDLLTAEDEPLRRGLYDLLHQRLFSLLAEVLVGHRAAARQQRLLGLLSGLSSAAAQPRGHGRITGDDLLAWAGLLAGQARGADALERLLGGWSGVPCTIEECIALWTAVPAAHCARLGAANSTLGRDCVAGGRVLTRATAMRITVGPVAGDADDAWRPGGRHLDELLALTDLLNGDALDVEVVLLVDSAASACPPLGRARLGRDLRTAGMPPPLRRELVHRTTGNR